MPSFLRLFRAACSLTLAISEVSQRWHQVSKHTPPVTARRRIPLNTKRILVVVAFLVTLSTAAITVHAQQPQIPTLQVCNKTEISGSAEVRIVSRADATHTGTFRVNITVRCDPNTGYPTGSVNIVGVSMFDSTLQGMINGTSLEQVTSTGKYSPTAYLNGRCRSGNTTTYRYWMMIADNKRANAQGTPDVISFLVFDATGNRVAYGTGPVITGDIEVAATGN